MSQNIFFNRDRFVQANAWCEQQGITPEESILRTAEPLKNGNGLINFNIKATGGKRNQQDVLLNENDLFIPYAMGLFISFEEVDSKGYPLGKAPYYSYAPMAGPGVPVGFKTQDIQALYNGLLTMNFGQTMALNSFPLLNFKIVPETQPIAINNGTALVSSGLQPEFSTYKNMYPLAPNIYQQGTEDIQININFPATGSDFTVVESGASEASTKYFPFLNFVEIGLLVKGGARLVQNPLPIRR